MSEHLHLFPLGVALGESFCNRTKERKVLAANIKNGRHTLLISPRRYGKTSLALQALQETNSAHTVIDFLLAANEDNVEKYEYKFVLQY